MRAATSAALQLAERSSIVAATALGKSPTGFRFRRQMWPLSRWVCTSTKSGSTIRPAIATSGAVAEVDGASGGDLRDRALVDEDVDNGEAVKVERRHGLRQHAAEHARLLQRVASGGGEGERHRRSALPLERSGEARATVSGRAHAKTSAALTSGAGRGRRPCSRTAAYRPSCNRDRPSRRPP